MASLPNEHKFRFCIDRGGTFTDIYAELPGNQKWKTVKLLSVDPSNYDDAPREGIRRILEEVTGEKIHRNQKIPTSKIEWIRMGTTVATNALLERKGEKTVLCVTKGFKDLLEIGNQARPDIFDLKVKKTPVLHEGVIEAEERIYLVSENEKNEILSFINDKKNCKNNNNTEANNKNNNNHNKNQDDVESKKYSNTFPSFIQINKKKYLEGISGEWVEIKKELNEEKLKKDLQKYLEEGYTSLAVAFMHSYTFPYHEKRVVEIAKSMGYNQVSSSSELIPMVKIVPRGETSVVDSYLTPSIQNYLNGFLSGFDDLKSVGVSFMQSDGGLTPHKKFSGYKAILSGPAGGVVGYALTSFNLESNLPVIGFDMGGTSTDVSRYDGNFEKVFETKTAGVNIQAPQLNINTVAAGGGSMLKFTTGVFKVGPESVSAHPGPVCYRKGGKLSITDANLFLGRILPDYFPKIFGLNENEPLDVDSSKNEFKILTEEINSYRKDHDPSCIPMTPEEVALGYLKVANETMCRPIRQITEMKGYDVKNHILSCFGGAGPQHGCSIARDLKIKSVLIHRFCGILSAYGMGLSDIVSESQSPSNQIYTVGSPPPSEIKDKIEIVKKHVEDDLIKQGFKSSDIETTVYLNLRYEGTDTSIMVSEPSDNEKDFSFSFIQQFRREYGFELKNRKIIIDDVRVHGVGHSNIIKPIVLDKVEEKPKCEEKKYMCYFESGWKLTDVFLLEKLTYGHEIVGPAFIMNGNSTILVEPNCIAKITKYGNVLIDVDVINPISIPKFISENRKTEEENSITRKVDLIQLSIFSNRFMSIAEQMGKTLQRTSISTNIKERLDFSCALFNENGDLVANAPHVPVHLGSMSSTVKFQAEYWNDDLKEGDVIITNHPSCGGSHLPDITVITPVFKSNKIIFFVASRGHHAEIGGITPGSMPPFSKSLLEEGTAIKSFKLVQNGEFKEEEIRKIFLQGNIDSENLTNEGLPRVIPGTRKIEDNISDLRAQVAANHRGIILINELIEQYGLNKVQFYMYHVQANAEEAVREMLKKVAKEMEQIMPEKKKGKIMHLSSSDFMDDGSIINLNLFIDCEKGEAHFDFEGTSAEVLGNWNAPRAIVTAAIIYCIRCMVDVDIPLNQGCLGPIQISVPRGCFLWPGDLSAVVGGNVLTSQRVTDVVLSAFQACACSQGCMNNLTFGNDEFGYYETIGGGSGAGPSWNGSHGVQTHMTNTRMTDPEIFERRYPVILHTFGLREGSGGEGKWKGGNGIIREIEFLSPITVSILSERRVHAPRGLMGGEDGKRGCNLLKRVNGSQLYIGGKNSFNVKEGDVLSIETPGGGGWGQPN